ncbi:hypothetical protein RJ641_032647 [Dillenia turbinata]|uniref:Glycosyltransferase N-terminal domain-containing protein n=1 Tax=Dillenia turbinata TaxID=194707 RepID=A0AAN8VWN0_9MAGN
MEEQRYSKVQVVVLPFPTQGHTNQMLQFSKRLASKGLKLTLAKTLSSVNTMQAAAATSINLETIYDDCTEGGIGRQGGLKGFIYYCLHQQLLGKPVDSSAFPFPDLPQLGIPSLLSLGSGEENCPPMQSIPQH